MESINILSNYNVFASFTTIRNILIVLLYWIAMERENIQKLDPFPFDCLKPNVHSCSSLYHKVCYKSIRSLPNII